MNQALSDYLATLPLRTGTKIPFAMDFMRLLRHPWFSAWIADLDLSGEAAVYLAGLLAWPDNWQFSVKCKRREDPGLIKELETKKAFGKFRRWRRDGSVRGWQKTGRSQ